MLQQLPLYAYLPASDVVADLAARGIMLEHYHMPGERSASGVVTADGAKAAWFKDSEGNILAVIEDA
jgi:hypothetical protein